MEYKVEFSDGTEYMLREYYDCDNGGYHASGMEVWDTTDKKCIYYVPGASFLDEDDEDAPEYNAKEIAYIEQYGIEEGFI